MESLNYHQLEYFWVTAREGGVLRAARTLGVSQPTVSAQLRRLEKTLGTPLLERQGRGVALTDAGRAAYRIADEIFSLGHDLVGTVRSGASAGPITFEVGVSEALPRLVTHALLQPALQIKEPVRLICREGTRAELLAALAVYELDIVLSDGPIGPQVRVRAFNHLLGECGVSIFGAEKLARRHRRSFPQSLDGAPFLLPTPATTLRRSLDQWFESHKLRPRVVGEFDDMALLKVFAQQGHGLFAAPEFIDAELRNVYRVRHVGPVEGAIERYFAISDERKLKHPAVVAMVASAQKRLGAPVS